MRRRALRRDLLDAGNADDVQDVEHDRILAVGKRHHHRMIEDGRILGVLDAKDIAAAATNLERPKRRLLEIHSDLLKHVRTLLRRELEASARPFPRCGLQRIVALPEFSRRTQGLSASIFKMCRARCSLISRCRGTGWDIFVAGF